MPVEEPSALDAGADSVVVASPMSEGQRKRSGRTGDVGVPGFGEVCRVSDLCWSRWGDVATVLVEAEPKVTQPVYEELGIIVTSRTSSIAWRTWAESWARGKLAGCAALLSIWRICSGCAVRRLWAETDSFPCFLATDTPPSNHQKWNAGKENVGPRTAKQQGQLQPVATLELWSTT